MDHALRARTSEQAIERGVDYLTRCQSEAGSLHGHCDGPMLIPPGYVFAHYATGTPIPDTDREGLIGYFDAVQNPDGGFGFHIDGPSVLYTTTLCYIALRLLGADSPGALRWIREHGGAATMPSWGKWWLAILRLSDWRGVNPVLPELWLLPRWVPIHPRRFWSVTRVTYLPQSYLYGRRWQMPDDPLIAAIRDEIFLALPDCQGTRNPRRNEDIYVRASRVLRAANVLLGLVDRLMPRRLRRRALALVLDHVEHEEATTDFIAHTPVNKVLDVVALHAAGSPLAQRSIDALPRHLIDGDRGLTVMTYNSTEDWETALAAQALATAGRTQGFADGARRFLLDNQIRADIPDARRYHRDPTRGGWTLGNRANTWTVADCTAEALLALTALGGLERERAVEAVDLLLGMQNPDGGWPAYERRRGPTLLELLNPVELFANVMVDHSTVEVTASVIEALVTLRPLLGKHRDTDISLALSRGERFLRRRQRSDGAWIGSWGICFTYGTWFAARGLRACGAPPTDPALRAAARFLLTKQFPDGGWGESWEGYVRGEYVPHPDGSQPVMTAWALLGLLNTGAPHARDAIERGVRNLRDSQLDDGDWPQHTSAGAFNSTCVLDYRFYRNTFPIWALGLAAARGISA